MTPAQIKESAQQTSKKNDVWNDKSDNRVPIRLRQIGTIEMKCENVRRTNNWRDESSGISRKQAVTASR